MRAIIVVMAAGAALAGCSKGEVAATNTAAPLPASSASASATFAPPTSTSRADYGTKIERRFRKFDKNQDNKLSEDELPGKNAARMMKRFDTNGDGFVDADEWSKGMLARFDKKDVNHDGNLTSDEKGQRGGGKRGGKRRQQMQAEDSGDEGDNDF